MREVFYHLKSGYKGGGITVLYRLNKTQERQWGKGLEDINSNKIFTTATGVPLLEMHRKPQPIAFIV
jgi:hypothetical protein